MLSNRFPRCQGISTCGYYLANKGQRIAQKCGHEFLALVNSDRNCKVIVIDIVQKIVFQDEEGNTISETDGSLVGKLIEVRFNSLH